MVMEDVNLSANDVEGLVLSIKGSGSIRGFVESESGEPLPEGLSLYFEFVRSGAPPDRPVPVRVAADGTFLLSDVQAGESFVAVALPSGANQFIASAEINGADLLGSEVKIIEGAEAGPVRIKLSQSFGIVSGSVAQTGTDSVVMFIPLDAAKRRFRTQYTTVSLDNSGSFSTRLAPGEYLVLVRNKSELPSLVTTEFISGLESSLTRVSIVAGPNSPLRLVMSGR
jgi:hypothetical protein